MQPEYQAYVDNFLKCKHVAILGYSHDDNQPANYIHKRMSEKGYTTYLVNPNPMGFPEGVKVHAHVKELPDEVCAAVLCTPPAQTIRALEALTEKGIQKVWIHKGMGTGSFVDEAEGFAKKHDMLLIPDGCPMMFVEPDFFHSCLKTCLDWFGRLRVEHV